jgi:hypothetical protein
MQAVMHSFLSAGSIHPKKDYLPLLSKIFAGSLRWMRGRLTTHTDRTGVFGHSIHREGVNPQVSVYTTKGEVTKLLPAISESSKSTDRQQQMNGAPSASSSPEKSPDGVADGSSVDGMEVDAELEAGTTAVPTKTVHGKLWDTTIGLTDEELRVWEEERKYTLSSC